ETITGRASSANQTKPSPEELHLQTCPDHHRKSFVCKHAQTITGRASSANMPRPSPEELHLQTCPDHHMQINPDPHHRAPPPKHGRIPQFHPQVHHLPIHFSQHLPTQIFPQKLAAPFSHCSTPTCVQPLAEEERDRAGNFEDL
ncbi:hypothetical protein KC19_VG258400, partial [Ceratodon purpureus]